MAKYTQGKYPIIQNSQIADGIYSLSVACGDIAKTAKAGQFANIKIDGFTLRRPVSIAAIKEDTLGFIYEIRGKGTEALSILKEGDLLDIVVPLGNGFALEHDGIPYKTAVLIGGGIGTPPMLPLAEHFGVNGVVITGFRNSNAVILQDEFIKTGVQTVLCTDDGSAGRKGFVTDALDEILRSNKPDIIYACGPAAMLNAVVKIADNYAVKCQVSLEERMACGVGACLVCACKAVKNGQEYYAHVCKDGPVFYSNELF